MESPQIVPSPAPAQLPPQDPAQLPPPDPAQLAPVEPDFRPACKPKKRGRGRGMGHTFFDQILYGQNGCKIVVRLEAPAPGEECPLTLSPIAEDSLEFLQPTTAYLTAFPAYKKMTLPCGHGFGALSILYHLARRNMLCPCCRAGLDTRLSPHCVPSAFRKTFLEKIQRERKVDAQELFDSDHRAASGIAQAEASFPGIRFVPAFLASIGDLQVTLGARFLTYNESRPPIVIMSFPMVVRTPQSSPDRSVFALVSGLRIFEANLRDPSVCELDLRIFFETSVDMIEVARVGTVVVNRNLNRQNVSVEAQGDSTFSMEMQEGGARLISLEWAAPTTFISSFH